MNSNDLYKFLLSNNLYNVAQTTAQIHSTWGLPYAISHIGTPLPKREITAYDLLQTEPEEININMGLNDTGHSSRSYIKMPESYEHQSTVKQYNIAFLGNKDYALCSLCVYIYLSSYKDYNVGSCSWGLTNTNTLAWNKGLTDAFLDLDDIPNFNYWPTAEYNNYIQDTTWIYTLNYLCHVTSPYNDEEYQDYTDLFGPTDQPKAFTNGLPTNIYLFYDKMNRKLYYGSYNTNENKWRNTILTEDNLNISITNTTKLCYGCGWRTNDANQYRFNAECPDFSFNDINVINWLKSITI